MSWRLLYAKQAVKDAKKLAASGLKPKAEELLRILSVDPYRNPPPFEKLVGDLTELIREESISSTDWFTKSSPTRKSFVCFECGRTTNSSGEIRHKSVRSGQILSCVAGLDFVQQETISGENWLSMVRFLTR